MVLDDMPGLSAVAEELERKGNISRQSSVMQKLMSRMNLGYSGTGADCGKLGSFKKDGGGGKLLETDFGG